MTEKIKSIRSKCLSEKKTGACTSSSRNYDLSMQFCNTSLRRWGQRSVALHRYVVARRSSTNHGTQQSPLTQKRRH